MAQGMSNAEIAGSLNIGDKTVKGHVSNVLGKLTSKTELRPQSTHGARALCATRSQCLDLQR